MRFLFYLALFYVIYKLVRIALNSRVTVNNYNYTDKRDSPKEGEVHIKKDPSDGKGSKSLDDAGDYVDYEEVKD